MEPAELELVTPWYCAKCTSIDEDGTGAQDDGQAGSTAVVLEEGATTTTTAD